VRGVKRVKYALRGRPRRERLLLPKLPRGAVAAEIGVFRGEFTDHILRVTEPNELHLFDGWWEMWGDAFTGWAEGVGTRDAYEEVRAVVRRRTAEDICTFHVGDDVILLEDFPDAYFDWVYVDSSHQFEHTLTELEILDRKVKPTGLIAGDDWREDPAHRHHGVCRAVRDFCSRTAWEVCHTDEAAQWCIGKAVGTSTFNRDRRT